MELQRHTVFRGVTGWYLLLHIQSWATGLKSCVEVWQLHVPKLLKQKQKGQYKKAQCLQTKHVMCLPQTSKSQEDGNVTVENCGPVASGSPLQDSHNTSKILIFPVTMELLKMCEKIACKVVLMFNIFSVSLFFQRIWELSQQLWQYSRRSGCQWNTDTAYTQH